MNWKTAIVVGSSGSGKSYFVAQYLNGQKNELYYAFGSPFSYDLVFISDPTQSFYVYLNPKLYALYKGDKIYKRTVFQLDDDEVVFKTLAKFPGRKLLVLDDIIIRRGQENGMFLRTARNYSISYIITTQRLKYVSLYIVQNIHYLFVFRYRYLRDLEVVLTKDELKKVSYIKPFQKVMFRL